MKKKDILLAIGVVVIIGVAFLLNSVLNSGNGSKVEIYLGNELYKTVSLDKEQTIEINNENGKNVIKIHDNGVEMTTADCPDKVCVNTGFINKPNQSIVCLPHKLSVKIVGEADSSSNDVDAK